MTPAAGTGDAGVSFRRFTIDELDLVEPLWSALREHHGSVTPEWGPIRDRADSWQRRRAQYEEWFAEPATFGLLAVAETGEAIGYSVIRVGGTGSPTWDMPPAAEIETLALLPASRGRGIGTRLIATIRAELRAIGVTQVGLHAIIPNRDAVRFYEREGFEQVFVAMSAPV